MKRNNGSQKLWELVLFREEGRGCGRAMRGGRMECARAWQSRSSRDGAVSNAACAAYVNQVEVRKNFRYCRLSSKLEPRQVIGSINRWIARFEGRDSCAVTLVRRSIEHATGCRHA